MKMKKDNSSSSSSSSSRSSSGNRSRNTTNENTHPKIPHQLSELEIRRLENIARNEAFLRSIGLADVQQSISEINQRDAAAATLNPDTSAAARKRPRRSTGTNNNKRSRSSVAGSSKEPTRRSTRGSATIEIDGPSDSAVVGGRRMPTNVLLDNDMTMDDDDVIRKKITAPSLREFIEKNNVQHSELIKDKDIVHTVYRMSYMGISALAKRLRDVSRGSGKASQHKMLLFYYALKAAELPELAQNALKVLHSYQLPDLNP